MMHPRRAGVSALSLLVVWLALAFSSVAHSQASPYQLEILNIKPAGTGNPVLPATNRIFHAYPGIEYNIRAAVIGGTFPYRFSLANAPAGMTINPDTGEISWPNPAQSTGTITLRVQDSAGGVVQANWTVSVHTNGFWFVDGDYTGSSTGSISQPFKSLLEMVTATQGRQTDIVYLRESARPYTVQMYPSGSIGRRYDAGFHLNSAERGARGPETLLAYPGERPVIDLQNTLWLRTDKPYFDGLTILNGGEYSLVTIGGSNYATIRRSTWSGVQSVSSVNNNQGFVFAMNDGVGYNSVYQDNDWSGFVGATGIGSLYYMNKLLIEDNNFHDGGFRGAIPFATPIGLKVGNLNATVRRNIIQIPAGAEPLGMYNADSGAGALDFSFNFVRRAEPGVAIEFFEDPANVHMYRNTVVGDVQFSEGPYFVRNNVFQGTLTGMSSVTEQNNLRGNYSAGFVDARGNLTGSYTQYIGILGYQLGAASAKTPANPELLPIR